MVRGIVMIVFGIVSLVVGYALTFPVITSLIASPEAPTTALIINVAALGMMFGGLALFVVGCLLLLYKMTKGLLWLLRQPFALRASPEGPGS